MKSYMGRLIRKMCKAALGLALIVLAILIVALLTRPLWQRDWVPRNCQANLVSHWPVLKSSDLKRDSAFDLLQRAAEEEMKVSQADADQYSKERQRANIDPWSEAAFPSATRMLKEAAGALALARSAAAAPDPQVLTYTSPADRFPYLTGVMRLEQLFPVSAAERVGRKDFQGAYTELESAVAFARILSRGGVLIHTLVDVAGELQACRAMRLIALRNDVPADVAQHEISYLMESDKAVEPLADTFRQESQSVPVIVHLFFQPRGPTLFGFFDEKTAAIERVVRLSAFLGGRFVGSSEEKVTSDLTQVHRCLVALAESPYNAERLQHFEENIVPSVTPGGLSRLNDPLGYEIAKLTLPVFPGVIVRYHRRAAELRATALVIALRQYQKAEGHRPATLQELVPKYISAIPTDPFDGEPFRYRVRPDGQWIVYSVGPNGIDEKGEHPKIDPHKVSDPGDVVFSEGD
jgi:hypothetical protein